MDKAEILDGLLSLQQHCQCFVDTVDPDCIWAHDVAVLKAAIALIEHYGAAPDCQADCIYFEDGYTDKCSTCCRTDMCFDNYTPKTEEP